MKKRSWRYLLVKIISEKSLTTEGVKLAVNYAVRSLFGEWGLMKIAPRILSFDEKSNKVIIRCNSSAVNKLRASLVLMTRTNDYAAAICVIKISGTIKSLKRLC